MPDAAAEIRIPPEGFTDLHCHLIPGIDDGPADMEAALALCRQMVEQGVRTATATPHQSHSWPANTAGFIRERLADLQRVVKVEGVGLEVLAGADVRVDADFLERLKRDEIITVADRGKAVLLELPDNVVYPLGELSFQLRLRRVVPVLTHPERCDPLTRDLKTVREWAEQGMLMQVTTGSLLGEFGPRARTAAEEMVNQGLVAFFASDAHGPEKRKPNHRAAYARIAELWGPDAARKLMVDNPAAVLAGKPVRPVEVRPPEPPRRSFWARLFGG